MGERNPRLSDEDDEILRSILDAEISPN